MPILLQEQEQLIALKVETTYGVDATPLGANAIMVQDITVRALEGDVAQRNNFTGFLGNQGSVRLNTNVAIDFAIELSGSAAAGTAPYYSAIYKIASHSETVTAATKVDYALVSTAQDSGTIYYMVGEHKHTLRGVRGTIGLEFSTKALPRLRFRGVGLYTAPAKVVGGLTGVSFASVLKPLAWIKDNVPTLTLHGNTLNAASVTFEQGMGAEHLVLIAGEEIILPQRSSTLSIKLREDDLTTVNWFEISRAGTTGAFAMQFGINATHAGRIFELNAAKVDVANVERSFDQGIAFLTLSCGLIPTAKGNDYTFIHR